MLLHAKIKPSLRLPWMIYELGFLDEAWKEWGKLDKAICEQFKKNLTERLQHPHVPAAKLSDANNRYKIKLRTAGFRLVYEVRDHQLIVVVIAMGKRDKNLVYATTASRSSA